MGKNYIINSFYCLNCGKKNMDLPRKTNKLKGEAHRKKLYCYHCKEEVNHLECRNEQEVREFKENFANGIFIEEAQESINFIKEEKANGKIW